MEPPPGVTAAAGANLQRVRLVTLRTWERSDAPALEPACGDDEICRFTTVPRIYTLGAAEAWIERQHQRERDGSARVRAIVADQIVGMAGLFGIREGEARFGYWTIAAFRGQGYTTTAVRLLAGWAFDQRGLQAVHIDIEPGNSASRSLAEAVGATPAGRVDHGREGVVLDRFTLTA
jgi:RimJ/RimL family protein N-acetyltransferase